MTRTHATRTIVAAAALLILAAAAPGLRTQALMSALPTRADAPADNPSTPEKVALGRLLFWDPVLSGQGDVACATCHHPSLGYADGLDLSVGVNGTGLGTARHFAPGGPAQLVKRNSQTILNAAFNGLDATGTSHPASAPMFWDVRAASLEAQALEPIKALEEMRGDTCTTEEAVGRAVARVAAVPEYRAQFARAFGGRNPVTATNLARAIAAFERTLVAVNSPFVRYMRGDTTAMTPAQVRGMTRFQTMGCTGCHNGPMLSDYKTHVLGVPDNARLGASDAGAENRYAFRTASLRNLAYTAPYMHNGAFATLDDVMNFYNRVGRGRGGRGGRGGGGRFGGTQNPNVNRQDLDPLLRQVNVRGGRQDVIEFLGALNDDGFDRTIPATVPSGLTPGGRVQ
jgi:cytochrome c peroxidase